jgi:hypothetical protein
LLEKASSSERMPFHLTRSPTESSSDNSAGFRRIHEKSRFPSQKPVTRPAWRPFPKKKPLSKVRFQPCHLLPLPFQVTRRLPGKAATVTEHHEKGLPKGELQWTRW